MKLNAQILAGLTKAYGMASFTTIGIISIYNLPIYAQSTTFFCGSNKGIPVTYARTPRGNVPIIRWIDRSFGGNWTSQRRCEDVSRRFQRNYDNGTLKTIATGKFNGYPVLCAAVNQDDPCTEKTLLFTLKRNASARRVVERLLDSRGLAAGKIVNQSACKEDCPIYVNVDVYLSNATPE